jgi:hypothetical protein
MTSLREVLGIGKKAPKDEKPGRKYFEVFGDALSQVRFLQGATTCLIFLALYQAANTAFLLRRPPLVIRVDRLGEAVAVKPGATETAVSGPEVRNFVEHFLRYFTAHNAFTYDDDFKRAFSMMTPTCQRKLDERLSAERVVENIKGEQRKTILKIASLMVENDTSQHLVLKVRGSRVIESYSNPELRRQMIFEDSLVLAQIPRSEASPWGLLVEDWSESIFKNE